MSLRALMIPTGTLAKTGSFAPLLAASCPREIRL
jgi:hypothetical protein